MAHGDDGETRCPCLPPVLPCCLLYSATCLSGHYLRGVLGMLEANHLYDMIFGSVQALRLDACHKLHPAHGNIGGALPATLEVQLLAPPHCFPINEGTSVIKARSWRNLHLCFARQVIGYQNKALPSRDAACVAGKVMFAMPCK